MRRKSRKSKHDDSENSASEKLENNSNGSDNVAEESGENHETNSEPDPEPEHKRRKSDKRVSFSGKKAAKEKEIKEVDNGETQYEVESVLDEKLIKGIKHYLIRWKGYDADSDTWEPEDTLNCADLIKQYKSSRKNNTEQKSKKKRDAKKRSRKSKDSEEPDWDENEEFEVDRIIEVHHKKGGKREFLVSWKGYPSTQNSWVEEDDMTCGDLIDKFMAKVERAKEVEQKDLRVKRTHTDRFTLSTFDSGRRLSKRNSGKQRVQYHDAE